MMHIAVTWCKGQSLTHDGFTERCNRGIIVDKRATSWKLRGLRGN